MKKQFIWIIVGLILVAFVYLFITQRNNDNASNQVLDSNQTENITEQTEMESSGSASLKELMSRSTSTRCEFSTTEESNNSSGVVYAANGKGRVDFSSINNGQVSTGHMIMDNDYAYTWIDGQEKGFKVSTATAASTQPSDQTKRQFDADKKMDYKCENWSADNSIFFLPANMEFTDLSAMMNIQGGGQGSMTPPTSTNSAQCAACDQAPEASRAQCRAALGCK